MYQASVNGLRVELLSDTPDPQATTVRVAGEIDVASAATLRDALEVACEPDRRVLVDMGAVTFIDSSGVRVLLGLAERAGDAHRGLVVQNPSRNVGKILGILGLRSYFGLDGSQD